jgi:hypothetical protein
MKQFKIIIFLFLVISGCTKELKIDFKEPTKKIVLYPFLIDNVNISIKMSAPAGILSNNFPILYNAVVIITDNDIPVDTVEIDCKGNGLSKIIPISDHEYGFRATATGYPEAVCVAQLPKPVEAWSVVDTTHLSFFGMNYVKFSLKIKDDPNTQNFYKVTIYRKKFVTTHLYSEIYPNIVSYDSIYICIWKPRVLANNPIIDFFCVMGSDLFLLARDEINFGDASRYRYELGSEMYFDGVEYYFPDDLFNGKEMILDLIVEETNISSFPEKYMIELSSISEDYFLGLKSYARYGTKELPDLPVAEEVSIYSAVNGGYGFPIALTTVIDSSFWMQH